jgi:hypothetical protein
MLNAQLILEYLKSDIRAFFSFVFQIRIKSNQINRNFKNFEFFY